LKHQNEAAQQWLQIVKQHKYDEAAKLLEPALAGQLSADKLREMFRTLSARYGALEDVGDADRERFGDQQLVVVRLRWERANLAARFLFDDEQRITDVWLGASARIAPPEGFRDDEFCFGETAHRLAKATLSLVAEVVDVDGRPLGRSSIAFWREVLPGEPADKFDWHDSQTGKTWRGISGAATGSSMTADRLLPGVYRVTAREGHYLAAPFGMSDPVTLDGSQSET
jgi:hypothetical protein